MLKIIFSIATTLTSLKRFFTLGEKNWLVNDNKRNFFKRYNRCFRLKTFDPTYSGLNFRDIQMRILKAWSFLNNLFEFFSRRLFKSWNLVNELHSILHYSHENGHQIICQEFFSLESDLQRIHCLSQGFRVLTWGYIIEMSSRLLSRYFDVQFLSKVPILYLHDNDFKICLVNIREASK